MGFVILGIIILIVGFVLSHLNPQREKIGNIFRIGGLVLIIIGVLSSTVRIVAPGEIGVQTLFGRVLDQPIESGMHVVNPLVEITSFNVKTQNYTMSGVHDEGSQEGDDAIRVLSADGLEVIIDLTVL